MREIINGHQASSFSYSIHFFSFNILLNILLLLLLSMHSHGKPPSKQHTSNVPDAHLEVIRRVL
jgi:hypothetical protein